MKNMPVIFLTVIILSLVAYPQKMRDKFHKNKDKLEQLEKIKLIEALDLNEDISIRLFSRKNDLKKETDKLEDRNEAIIDELEKSFDSNEKNAEIRQNQLLNEFLKNKQDIETLKQQFISSLSDILSREQVCKFVVFEKKFRDEIKSVLMEKRHQKNNN